jgi:hypothetical protein
MPAGPWQRYEVTNNKIERAEIDQVNDTLLAMLLVDGHTVDIVTHQFVSDVVGDEVAGGGDYTRLTPLTGQTVDLLAGKSLFNIDDLDFGDTVTISARYVVIARNIGADTSNELLYICDLSTGGSNLSSDQGNFDIGIPNGVQEVTPNV